MLVLWGQMKLILHSLPLSPDLDNIQYTTYAQRVNCVVMGFVKRDTTKATLSYGYKLIYICIFYNHSPAFGDIRCNRAADHAVQH